MRDVQQQPQSGGNIAYLNQSVHTSIDAQQTTCSLLQFFTNHVPAKF